MRRSSPIRLLRLTAFASTLDRFAMPPMLLGIATGPPAPPAAVVSLFAGCLFSGSALAAVLVAGPAGDGRYRTIFLLAAAVAVPLGVLAVRARARRRRPA